MLNLVKAGQSFIHTSVGKTTEDGCTDDAERRSDHLSLVVDLLPLLGSKRSGCI